MWIEITKTRDWPGIGRGYNIRIEGMKYPNTVYVPFGDSGEGLEEAIERVKKNFFGPNLLIIKEIHRKSLIS